MTSTKTKIEQLERERLSLDREWKFSTAQIELIKQLQTEDSLEAVLNDLRIDLNLQPFEDIVNITDSNQQIDQLILELEATLAEQTQLPEQIQSVLNQIKTDLTQVLAGQTLESIQDNLVTNVQTLMTEANRHQSELLELNVEEQLDQAITPKNRSQSESRYIAIPGTCRAREYS